MAESRLQMTELERAEADRDEARQEALDLRAALADLVAVAKPVVKEIRAKVATGVIQDHLFHAKGNDLNAAVERACKVLKND